MTQRAKERSKGLLKVREMSSIKGYISELKLLNMEIKRLNDQKKTLQKKADEAKKNIALYLQDKEQNGVKYNDVAVVLENKDRRMGKSNKEKDSDAIRVLQDFGVRDPHAALDRLLESRRGEKVSQYSVKLTSIEKLKKK